MYIVLKVIRAEAETSLEVMNKNLFILLLFLMKIDNFVLTEVPNIQNTMPLYSHFMLIQDTSILL